MDDQRSAIIEAFEEHVAKSGWSGLELADLAKAADLSLAELHQHFPRKIDLLEGLVRQIDQEVLDEGFAEADEPAKDRLFEIMMRRMDALQDRRPAIEALLRDLPKDPAAVAWQAVRLPQSMSWMLRAALIDASGWMGGLKARTLAALYLWVLKTWKEDETEDLAQTMKALDERLRLAEEMANTFIPKSKT